MSNSSEPQTQSPLEPGELENAAGEEILGKWGHRLRTICGAFSVITVCICSLIFAWTMHESVSAGKGYPDRMTSFVLTFGPVIMGWAFMNVNKILGMLITATKDSPSIRNRLAGAITGFQEPRKEERKED